MEVQTPEIQNPETSEFRTFNNLDFGHLNAVKEIWPFFQILVQYSDDCPYYGPVLNHNVDNHVLVRLNSLFI